MSKTEKMRGRLASIQRDREEFEKQKRELEADMNVGRNNMHKINKGLRNNAILEEQIVVDPHTGSSSGAHATPHHSSKPSSERGAHSRGASFDLHPSGTSSAAHSNSPLPTGANSSSNALTGAGGATPNSAAAHFFLNGSGANASTGGNGNSPGSMVGIMPSGPRVSDWCYTAPMDSPAPPTVKSREMYENVRLLGRGSFGEVNLVKNTEDNKLFAIKTQLCPKESEFHSVLKEVRALRWNRHPCIIDLHDAFLMLNPRIVYIVMHYCESGTIAGMISSTRKNKATLAESQILKWVLQLALAMQFLHENHVLHRDLKPMNVMLTEGGDSLKLADFGLVMYMSEKAEEEATDEAGTPYYTAPEMIQREPYSYPADCWSFGVIVHQLLALERPFDGNHTADLVKSILSGEIPPLPAHYSEEIKLISRELLRKDQTERLTMTELLLEPIFHSKLGSFPQNYRPRTLEERIRRSHQKQLEAQIESLNRCRKTDGPKNLHEKVALRQQAAAEAEAAAAATAAALASSETAGENGATSPVNLVGGTPRTRSNSNSVQTTVSTRSNSLSGARTLPTSLSNTRLSNADATAPQASAAVAAVSGGLSIDAPDTTTLPSQKSFGSPDRPDRTPLSRNTHPIPEENPDELNAPSTKISSTTVYSDTNTEPTATSATEEAPDATAANPSNVSSSSVTVEPSARTSPVPLQDSPIGHLAGKESSIETISSSPIKTAQSERDMPISPAGHLGGKESSIETIAESPVKVAVSERELSAPRLGSSGGDGSTPHGGRKGMEIARAKENDSFFEAQLGSAPEELSESVSSPHSQSHTAGNNSTAGDAENSADSGVF